MACFQTAKSACLAGTCVHDARIEQRASSSCHDWRRLTDLERSRILILKTSRDPPFGPLISRSASHKREDGGLPIRTSYHHYLKGNGCCLDRVSDRQYVRDTGKAPACGSDLVHFVVIHKLLIRCMGPQILLGAVGRPSDVGVGATSTAIWIGIIPATCQRRLQQSQTVRSRYVNMT